MKRQAAALLMLTMVALPGLVNAQIKKVIKAEVPFEFVANGKTMPAGACTVEVDGSGQTILLISSGNQRLFVAPNATRSMNPSEKTSLVFHRYGDRYFLAAINREGQTNGYELTASGVEKELRAQNVSENDVTLLVAAK